LHPQLSHLISSHLNTSRFRHAFLTEWNLFYRKQMATLQNLNFVPTSISGCQLWLDGRDPFATGTAPVNGAAISTWLDKSGNGRNFSNSLSASTYSLTENGLVFNGTNLYTSAYTASVTNETLFFVLNSSTQPSYVIGSSATGGRQIGIFSATQVGILNAGVAWGATTPTSTISLNSRFFGTSIVTSGSNTQIAVNGSTSFASSNITAFSAGTTQLGREGASTGPYSGLIHEVLSYNSVLSAENRQSVEGYLAWKWGLQGSLPSTHPYKLIAPNSAGLVYPSALTVPVPTQSFVPVSLPLVFFNPTTIAGLQLWLDGTDPAGTRIVPANGSTLSSWVDKSGNGRTLGVGSGTTTYSSNSVRLNTSYMFVANAVNLTNATFFIVTVSTTSVANQPVFTARPNTLASYASTDGFGMYIDSVAFGSQGVGCRLYGQQSTGQYTTPSLPTTTNFMMSAVFGSAGTLSSWINGGSQLSATYSARTNTAQGFAIGAEWNGSSYTSVSSAAYIYEVLVYNAALTTAQRQQIEGYLAWKWGLVSSLPSNHPYKTSVPGINLPVPIYSMQPVSFRPTQISGLQLWLDGQDPNGNSTLPANGATISTWTDKSGAGNSATGGTAVTYNTIGINNSPVLSFSGTPSYFNSTDLYSNRSFSVFLVSRRQAANNSIQALIGGTTTANNQNMIILYKGNTSIGFAFYGSDLDATIPAYTGSTSTEPAFLFAFTYTPGSRIISVNGTVGASDAYATNLTASLGERIGTWAGAGTGNSFSGFIGEILVYNAVPTTTSRQSVEGYLAWKWGLVGSLPATHPFKKFPPPPS
jgi:hypothetical protein